MRIIKDIPFVILTVITVYTVISGLLLDKFFTSRLYLGIITIVLNVLLYFINYSWFKYFFTTILLISTFNVVQYTYTETTIKFNINISALKVETIDLQVLSLLLLFLHMFLNRKSIIRALKNAL